MTSKRQIYSVADVNRKARMVLEGGIGELWVEGELSRVTIHSSGHWYFTLKDEQAAVSCAMFRNDNARVAFKPKDGLKVQMFARPNLYEANGRYQLIASEMEEAGKGNLQEQFEKLKAKPAAENHSVFFPVPHPNSSTLSNAKPSRISWLAFRSRSRVLFLLLSY